MLIAFVVQYCLFFHCSKTDHHLCLLCMCCCHRIAPSVMKRWKMNDLADPMRCCSTDLPSNITFLSCNREYQPPLRTYIWFVNILVVWFPIFHYLDTLSKQNCLVLLLVSAYLARHWLFNIMPLNYVKLSGYVRSGNTLAQISNILVQICPYFKCTHQLTMPFFNNVCIFANVRIATSTYEVRAFIS